MLAPATMRWRRWGTAVLVLGAAVAVLVALLLGSAEGNAQEPSDEPAWTAPLTLMGDPGNDMVRGEVSLLLTGQESWLLRFEANTPLRFDTVTGFAFFLGVSSEVPGGNWFDAAVILNCDGSLRTAQAGQTCAPPVTLEGSLSIFVDGFELRDVSAFAALLDAGRVVVDVRTTDGDLSGIFGVFPSRGFVAVEVPAGLSTFGYCGAPTDTNDLFQRHPALQAVFLLNPNTGAFDATQRPLPANIRPNFPIVPGQGMFLRAGEAFTMEIAPVQSVREAAARLSAAQFNFEEIGWSFQAGIQLLANCGDGTTNTALLGAHDAISRLATFDASTRKWTVIGKVLPPALRTEVPVPTSGALVVLADAGGTALLPCESAECQSFTATDDLFLRAMAR